MHAGAGAGLDIAGGSVTAPLAVRGVERVELSGVLAEGGISAVVGAVRLVMESAEIFAVVIAVWHNEVVQYRALYWDRNEKRFAYHPLSSDVIAMTFHGPSGQLTML